MEKWKNQVCMCIGTGRMGLALHKEYWDQLEIVQEEIGFSYIRGHGLFCDDMAIYQERKVGDEVIVDYNFTYVDRVFDGYLSLGLRPFVELGFMPSKLASGDHTVFYWKGNVTPPADYDKWCALVQATIRHWVERYGREEVLTWPMEVWNEPNLGSFWVPDGFDDYCIMYERTAKAVKEVDSELTVGGPAICGVNDEWWLREFLTYCEKHQLPIDFVTRHAYGADEPEWNGYYAYQSLRKLSVVYDELAMSRDIIDSFEGYKGMPMHITEYNTSYLPMCTVHDTNLNAAYIAGLLAKMGDTCASYSYWTFGDVFEEAGVPKTLFHGGFGLMANGCIPKPTYWTFSFFANLYHNGLERGENYVASRQDDNYRIVAYHPVLEGDTDEIAMTIPLNLPEGEYRILTKIVDEEVCNPRKSWIDLGTPKYPSTEEVEEIRETAYPMIQTGRIRITKDNTNEAYPLTMVLSRNEVRMIDVKRIVPTVIPGFDASRN